MRHIRPMPDDFREMQAKLGFVMHLAKHYGAGQTTVDRWMKEAGLKAPRQIKYPVPADFAEQVKVKHVLGLSRHYNVNAKVVRRWLADTELKASDGRGAANACYRAAPADFADVAPTMTATALRKRYIATWTTIQRWAQETGAHPMVYVPVPPKAKTKAPQAPRRGMVHAMGLSSNIAASKMHTIHDLAADTLRRERFPVYRCDERGRADIAGKFWRVGMTVLDDDGLLAKAARYERKAA